MELEEQQKYLHISDKYKLAGFYLEITSQCNMRCLHCYNDSGELQEEISMRAFNNIIADLEENEGLTVTLSGGEPLLHPRIWDFIKAIKDKNFGNALMITNATLIDENVAKKIVQANISIQVSINGSCAETHDKLCGNGSFQRTLRGIDNLLAMNYHDNIIVRCMLSNFNKNDILPFINMAVEKGIKNIIIAPLTLIGRSMNNAEGMYLNLAEKSEIIDFLNQSSEIASLKEQNNTCCQRVAR